MSQRSRKVLGTVVLLVFLTFYVWVAAAIGSGRIAQASALAQALYYLVAGLLWVIPAGALIRWMQRPD